MASKASTRLLRVLKSDDPQFEAEWTELCQRRHQSTSRLDAEIQAVIDRVREGGDAALLSCIQETSGATLRTVEVSPEEWDEACERVDPADRAAIGKASMRIREFHRKRIPSSWEMREEGGGYMGQRIRAMSSVGIHAAAGAAAYPSSIIMNVSPASVVEVPEIVLVTEPGPDGALVPEVLMAARVSGVHRVFKLGGAHAVAALAYGTATVPRVDKIVGGAGAEVFAAKRLVSRDVGIDAEVGSGEVCIVADKSATPPWLAAEMICQAEREEDARALLITHYKSIGSRVQEQLVKQLRGIGRRRIATQSLSTRGAIIFTKNLEESLALADQYAAQHVVLAVDSPDVASKSIQNAGAIFLGNYSPVAIGNYVAGPNAILPTGGTARFASPLGVEDFMKRTSFIRFEPPKLRELGAEVVRLAEVEGFAGPGTSVELRLQKIRRARREREAAREAEL